MENILNKILNIYKDNFFLREREEDIIAYSV